MAKENDYFCLQNNIILMKKLIQFLKRWSDRRLRERCVRRVLRSCRGTDRNVLYETENLYFFIKKEE